MGLLQSAYRVFIEEGINELTKETKRFLNYKTKKLIPKSMYNKIHNILLSTEVQFEVNNIKSTFDTSIITPDDDFRNDFNSEKSVISSFVEDIKQDDVIYDIGASVGIYSSFAGQVANDGKVVCFEPHPVVVPVLYQNLSNNCSDFEIIQIGISDESGFAKIQPNYSTDTDIKNDLGINIKLEKISDVVKYASLPNPTVAKIDVEGAELKVLKGFDCMLEDLELLFVEIHHKRGEKFNSSKSDIINLLSKQFVSVTELEQHERGGGTQTHIKASSR